MSLYSQAISVPFAQRIRTPNDAFLNGLDLGPDYDRIKQHMGAVIDQPDLLLGQGASHKIGMLYGEEWDNKEAIEFIQANQDSLPHLREVLTAFFQGALEMWKEFTKDICDDPKVTGATPEQRRLTFRHPANDNNEGALGTLRREYCQCTIFYYKISIYFYSSLNIPFTISLSLIIITLTLRSNPCSCTSSAKVILL